MVTSTSETDNTGQQLYRVRPPPNEFLVQETRLLEAGFEMDAPIYQTLCDVFSTIITKRYVLNRQKYYNLKDAEQNAICQVPEFELFATLEGSFRSSVLCQKR